MNPWLRRLVLATVLLLSGISAVSAALEVPYLQGRVTDDAEILSPDTRRQISAKLEAHEQNTTNQVAVLTVASLEGESIESFAVRVFQQWQLGQRLIRAISRLAA